MHPSTAIAGLNPAATSNTATTCTTTSTAPTVTGETVMHLLYEALSRARMQSPQAGTTRTEATRSARTIAMQARHRWASSLGGR
jgi:hypothetical protein